MSKNVVGVVSGLLVWVAIVVVAGEIMRLAWPAYARVAAAMTFTLPMLAARLSISFLATLAAGFVAASIAPRSVAVRLVPGLLLLVAFIPVHINLWDKFPVWYHLTFLLSLVLLTYFGGTLWSSRHRNGTVQVASEVKAV